MTKCIAPALILSECAFSEAVFHNVLADHADILTDEEYGQILKFLSDHIIALEVVAATLRKVTVA